MTLTSSDSTKLCIKCGEHKSLEAFYRSAYNKADGRATYCKSCESERQRRFREANREKLAEKDRQRYQREKEQRAQRGRRYYQANKEQITERNRRHYEAVKEQKAERARFYYQCNKERIKKQQRLYSLENKKQKAERRRCYYQKNKNKWREMVQRRRALIQNAEGSYSAEEWLELCNCYDNVCLCCSESKPLEVDHVVPLSKGGSNDIGNIQPLCRTCNASKGAKTIDYRADKLDEKK